MNITSIHSIYTSREHAMTRWRNNKLGVRNVAMHVECPSLSSRLRHEAITYVPRGKKQKLVSSCFKTNYPKAGRPRGIVVRPTSTRDYHAPPPHQRERGPLYYVQQITVSMGPPSTCCITGRCHYLRLSFGWVLQLLLLLLLLLLAIAMLLEPNRGDGDGAIRNQSGLRNRQTSRQA